MRRHVGVALVIFAGLSLSACDDSDSNKARNESTDLPADEAALIAAKTSVASAYDDAPNDIVKGQIYDDWRRTGSCAALKSPDFVDWIATVKSIQSGGGFIVEIGGGVELESTLGPSTPLFKVISGLREGDTVKISGQFVSDDPKCAIQVIAPPWGDSAIKNPDFNVSFSEITP